MILKETPARGEELRNRGFVSPNQYQDQRAAQRMIGTGKRAAWNGGLLFFTLALFNLQKPTKKLHLCECRN
ncbi:hypothetical protein ACV229_08380 [Burkholderia sp. MR1-5-21]